MNEAAASCSKGKGTRFSRLKIGYQLGRRENTTHSQMTRASIIAAIRNNRRTINFTQVKRR